MMALLDHNSGPRPSFKHLSETNRRSIDNVIFKFRFYHRAMRTDPLMSGVSEFDPFRGDLPVNQSSVQKPGFPGT